MYKIIEKNKQGTSLYTVVYSHGGITLPMCKSRDYQHCVDYIDKQPKETKVYDENKSKKALQNCLSQMYNNRNNGK